MKRFIILLLILFNLKLISMEFIQKTHIFKAVVDNQTEIVEKLLESGANINETDEKGRTLLMLAALYNQKDTFNLLINKNSSIDLQDNEGKNALHHAVKPYYNTTKTIEELHTEKTKNQEIIKKLVDLGLPINTKDNAGQTPLILACKHENKEAINILINNNEIEIDLQDNNGKTAIMYATIFQNFDIIKMLLNYNANINLLDKENDTPLMYAVMLKNLSILELLLKEKANPNIKNNKGQFPLTYAAKEHHNDIDVYTKIIKVLLDYDSDPKVQDKFKNTALTYVTRRKNQELINIIKQAIEKFNHN